MTAGALAARLALDASGFRAEMANAGTVADKELKRIGRQVQFVNDYIKEMARSQSSANQASAGIADGAKHMEHFGFQTASAKRDELARMLMTGSFVTITTSAAPSTKALSCVLSITDLRGKTSTLGAINFQSPPDAQHPITQRTP